MIWVAGGATQWAGVEGGSAVVEGGVAVGWAGVAAGQN